MPLDFSPLDLRFIYKILQPNRPSLVPHVGPLRLATPPYYFEPLTLVLNMDWAWCFGFIYLVSTYKLTRVERVVIYVENTRKKYKLII